eukprot:Sspe_Gene.40113::Locus_19347_Transcript_1_1_Confidence_1.000_Length_1387::g.40113::m.40113
MTSPSPVSETMGLAMAGATNTSEDGHGMVGKDNATAQQDCPDTVLQTSLRTTVNGLMRKPPLPPPLGNLVVIGDSLSVVGKVSPQERASSNTFPLVAETALRMKNHSLTARVLSRPGYGLVSWGQEKLLEDIKVFIAQWPPACLVLELGVNDFYHGISSMAYLTMLRKVVHQLRCLLPDTAMVLATVTPSILLSNSGSDEWVSVVNVGVQEIAATYSCLVADFYWALLREYRKTREWRTVLMDYVHPNDLGQVLLGQQLAATILHSRPTYSVSMTCGAEHRWMGFILRPRWNNSNDCNANPRVVVTLLSSSSLTLALDLPVPLSLSPPWVHTYFQLVLGRYRLYTRDSHGRVAEHVYKAKVGKHVLWELSPGTTYLRVDLVRKKNYQPTPRRNKRTPPQPLPADRGDLTEVLASSSELHTVTPERPPPPPPPPTLTPG